MKTILVSNFTNINNISNTRVRSVYYSIDGDKTVITTDFSNRKKRYYTEEEKSNPQQIHLHVPSYKANLSIKRIWSHLMFAKRLKCYLNKMDVTPDVVYCTMPSSSSAYVCAKYCKKHHVKFVIDVVDLWPDSLLPFVKWKSFLKLFLYPWTYLTRFAYKNADVILGESKKYVNEAKKYNKSAKAYPIYLGVDMNIIRSIENDNPVKITKPKDEIWIAYAGSLGTSYDFKTLLEAVKELQGKCKYKLLFIGDGVEHDAIESFIKDNNLNAEITGFLPYEKLLGYLAYCDIAINIFRKDTNVVYSYKFNDYVAMNCFVLNSLSGETAEMIDKYQIGRNFNYTNLNLTAVLEDTIKNWETYHSFKFNCKKLIAEKLNKENIYLVVRDILSHEK